MLQMWHVTEIEVHFAGKKSLFSQSVGIYVISWFVSYKNINTRITRIVALVFLWYKCSRI